LPALLIVCLWASQFAKTHFLRGPRPAEAKVAADSAILAASLKRCPDTNPEFFSKLFSRSYPRPISPCKVLPLRPEEGCAGIAVVSGKPFRICQASETHMAAWHGPENGHPFQHSLDRCPPHLGQCLPIENSNPA
jgi:hypothetical protein